MFLGVLSTTRECAGGVPLFLLLATPVAARRRAACMCVWVLGCGVCREQSYVISVRACVWGSGRARGAVEFLCCGAPLAERESETRGVGGSQAECFFCVLLFWCACVL